MKELTVYFYLHVYTCIMNQQVHISWNTLMGMYAMNMVKTLALYIMNCLWHWR